MENNEFEKMCQKAGVKKEALCDTVFIRQFRGVKKVKSIQAEVAQTIRKELKKKFPSIKFSVRSESFAGGNSIDIDYINGVPADDIRKIVNKYESGHFDGMTDCYNYHPGRDYPTAKFVMVNRRITEDIREKTKKDIAEKYGIKNINDNQEWFNKFQAWPDNVVYRELVNKTI